ncbi:MAG: tRNA uridine-5-carboxymethylaminomethyl(34) synthesis GTPase MnmE [Candidatus Omnitrophica bacterium CG1_02_49_10]|nr:MAG: tRNA uridine-5-carboxymethylaminomethyl(34) synthesis GTPase MnmE [Candidatus Omnitrophica bacterium CG1_02_49_10]
MDRYGLNGTIAAISTPIGKGGIGIVRLSGDKALDIAGRVFRPKNGFKPSASKSFTTHYGHIIDGENLIIDEALLTVMRRPRTYTREDIVEINCHSGIAVLRKILDLVIRSGARAASPGEFTKRAFLNGRLDLLQAEAVLDIIASDTESSRKAAFEQLGGRLSSEIRGIKDEAVDIYSHLEASIDFPDEDIDAHDQNGVYSRLSVVAGKLEALIKNADRGMILRRGLLVSITGRPNVGKSSLMNSILGARRSIVTPVSGTTRDTIEESVDIDGLPFRLVDTAGIVDADNDIDKEAVSRSREYADRADIVLFVVDGSVKLNKDDMALAGLLKGRETIALINKSDLKEVLDKRYLMDIFGEEKVLNISALTGAGMDILKRSLADMVWGGETRAADEALLTNARHVEAVREARDGIMSSLDMMNNGDTADVTSIGIKEAIGSLGEITGEVFTEDILDRIFSRFCIGK